MAELRTNLANKDSADINRPLDVLQKPSLQELLTYCKKLRRASSRLRERVSELDEKIAQIRDKKQSLIKQKRLGW